MGLITDHGGSAEEYEAVALPRTPQSADGLASAVFLRRSARPSRRAVLHLHDLAGSFAPADLVRWYNERGFHFYVTDLDAGDPAELTRRRPARIPRPVFAALDAACAHLRESDGIDAIILSAQESLAPIAAMWCDARSSGRPVDALILSNPDFGRARVDLEIVCPVLVIAVATPQGSRRRDRRERRGADAVKLGKHVTWLHMQEVPSTGQASDAVPVPERRRLFDEMGRWLGAYMYGQVRDQLL